MDIINVVVKQSTFAIVILHTKEGVYMLQRTHPHKPMYLMYQISGGKTELMETGKQAACREVYEETKLSIAHKRIKYLDNDPEFNCDLYHVYLRDHKVPERMESANMGSWLMYPWTSFYKMAAERRTTPLLTKF
jgi:8-oxo-dGTP pyrophosphatase MutT (NUDIX family)